MQANLHAFFIPFLSLHQRFYVSLRQRKKAGISRKRFPAFSGVP